MQWLLAMTVGAALMFICLVIIGLVAECRDDLRTQRRRQAVRNQRAAAEAQLQSVMQDTVSELFRAARGPQ